MERNIFLAQPDVADFIDWLCTRLPTLPLHLQVLQSPYVPTGLNVHVTGLPAVLAHYHWKASWTDADGALVPSSDWKSTKASLRRLGTWIKDALHDGDENDALKACVAILRWGGVRGALPFLHRLHAQRRLVAYFKRLAPLMALDRTGLDQLTHLDKALVERFDAGLTKIHALADASGSPILDSRVGAAAAMLYALYRQDARHGVPSILRVPSGGARGNQIRDPRALGAQFPQAPRFYTKAVEPHEWARSQVRLGWILRAVLEATDWFKQEAEPGDMAARCHAFEACLFMIGYDLRCFNNSNSGVPLPAPDMQENMELSGSNTGWVPTSHPFVDVITMYATFRRRATDSNINGANFQQYLIEKYGYQESTAKAYCFPLSPSEFDLYDISPGRLTTLLAGGEAGLYAALSSTDPYCFSEEREQVCVMDVFITGMVATLPPGKRVDTLMAKGYAGTPRAANVLLTVGRAVGSHFGLLDQQNQPTDFFHRFFAAGATAL